jgi:hypothetical protein
LSWTIKNYERLQRDHPQVAEACLPEAVTFDLANHRLVRVLKHALEKEPTYQFLDLKPLPMV